MHDHPDLCDTLRILRNEDASIRLAAVFLENAIWRRHGHARLSLREIAEWTGLSHAASQRAIRRLMALKFIERTRVGGRDNGSVYRTTNIV